MVKLDSRKLKTTDKSINFARNDFPILQTQMNGQPLAFLDTAASAQKPACVIEAMNDIYKNNYSNIHRGLYNISQKLTEEYETARAKIARFVGAASEKEIIFTRNATESLNLIAQSWGRKYLKKGDEIIISGMEHHANIVPWQLLQDQIGIIIKTIPVLEDGTLDLEALPNMLSTRTRLVSAVHISNGFGTINNINKITEITKEFNPKIKVCIDGSQGIVHTPVHMQNLGTDFYVFTGHKLYGPTGIGVLYGRYDILETMPPYQGGGDMIERVSLEEGTTYKEPPYRFEAGTPAIVEVIGLGKAIDYVQTIGIPAIQNHERKLLEYGTEKLRAINGLKLYGPENPDQKAGIFSFTMDCAHHSDIGMILDQCGVAIRTGHHCCMPLMHRFSIDGTARASLGLYSNADDINQLAEGLQKVRKLFA
ncbi:MAG: cysteine desulfurase [Alphaproteobacteria bacterium]|nr:cysteine desulfurase [Alphaproteobacteria bacterium]